MSFLDNPTAVGPDEAKKRSYRRLATPRQTYNAVGPRRLSDRPRSMRSRGLFRAVNVSNGNKQREPDEKTYAMCSSSENFALAELLLLVDGVSPMSELSSLMSELSSAFDGVLPMGIPLHEE